MKTLEQFKTILSLYLSERTTELYNCKTKEEMQKLNAEVQREFNILLKNIFGGRKK